MSIGTAADSKSCRRSSGRSGRNESNMTWTFMIGVGVVLLGHRSSS
jgi:hypothetical protein